MIYNINTHFKKNDFFGYRREQLSGQKSLRKQTLQK